MQCLEVSLVSLFLVILLLRTRVCKCKHLDNIFPLKYDRKTYMYVSILNGVNVIEVMVVLVLVF